MSWDWMPGALGFLALLACPAMMFWMMRGGSGQGCHGGAGAPPEREKDREIRALRARLEKLESQVDSEERRRSSAG